MATEVEVKAKPETKRVPDLDKDEEMVQSLVLIPEKHMKKLDALSVVKECSKGAIVREALRDYFDKQDKFAETPKGVKVSNKVIEELLGEATTYWGNFEVEGKKGFIALAKERGMKLKDLTEPQFEVVVERLEIGYKGYAVTPSVEEFIGRLSELEPTERQKDIIRKRLSGEQGGGSSKEEEEEDEWEEDEWEEEGEEEEEEEGW